MRKRWLFTAMATVMALSVTGCGKDNSQDVNVNSEINNPINQTPIDNVDPVVESTEDITEAVEETTGFVKVSDIKEEVLQKTMNQAQDSFRQLRLEAGMEDFDRNNAFNREQLFESLGLTEEEILSIDNQEELNELLSEKGLTMDAVYAYSIYLYLMEAAEVGDDSEEEGKEDYFTKTKELLLNYGLDYDAMMDTREWAELKTYVESGSPLSLYDLNCKLWVHEIFPGVDVEATELMSATSPMEFLAVFTEAGFTVEDLEKHAAEPDRAEELLGTLKKIEEESKAAEEENGGSGSSGSGSGTSKDDIKESIENKETEEFEIPDNGGANSVTLVIGNDGGHVTGSADADDDDTDENTTGIATVVVDSDEADMKIVVKKILRGVSAESEIDASNANLPGQIFVDEDDDDFEWVAVKFSVKVKNPGDEIDEPIRPLVRVKNLSGANIETVATRVFYIDPEETTSSSGRDYWVAFKLPEEQSKFMLYFGDPSGSVYKFKSTALYDEDED